MYNYFYLTSCGRKVWYKRYITMTQIVQFVVDLGFIYWVSYNFFATQYFENSAPLMQNQCAANTREIVGAMTEDKVRKHEFAAFTGLVCLTSYLFLFIAFYFATYRKPASGKICGAAQSNALRVKAHVEPMVAEITQKVMNVARPLA
jgi:fatty acid elongase 3